MRPGCTHLLAVTRKAEKVTGKGEEGGLYSTEMSQEPCGSWREAEGREAWLYPLENTGPRIRPWEAGVDWLGWGWRSMLPGHLGQVASLGGD